jgi:tripartite-type tricarboxylate transporter receptor subunit TctC
MEYPTKPVTLIVPFSAGGSADLQARLIAKGLSERLGKPVIVDNRAGAGGRIGATLVARAAPDGHTLLFGSISPLVIEPALRGDVGYDPLRDFTLITVTAKSPAVLLVNPSVPAQTLSELLTLARKQPGTLTYASLGYGTFSHLLAELFKSAAHLELLHVPYKGDAPAMLDVVGGQVNMIFTALPAALTHIHAGKLRALAITGAKRSPTLPAIPTLVESGVEGLNIEGWWGIVAPVKTPSEVTSLLHREILAVLKSTEFSTTMERDGAYVAAGSPQAFRELIEADSASIVKVVKAAKIKLEE